MGGTGERFPMDYARAIGERVLNVLAPHVEQAMVCGSIRRGTSTGGTPDAGDVDLVYVLRTELVPATKGMFDEEPGVPTKSTDRAAAGVREAIAGIADELKVVGQTKIQHTIVGRMQIDLWSVPADSFGAATLFATGSAALNIAMRATAKRRGRFLSQYGLFGLAVDKKGKPVAGERLAPRSEEEIFAALGLTYLPPEERSMPDGASYRWLQGELRSG
jgi:DNA polymerase/3'-5' exonuclease PolX